jgi:hypothetical protein
MSSFAGDIGKRRGGNRNGESAGAILLIIRGEIMRRHIGRERAAGACWVNWLIRDPHSMSSPKVSGN